MSFGSTAFSTDARLGELPATRIDGPGGALRVALARPRSPARATIFMLQGRGEFLAKYRPVARELVDCGYAFLTFDWRGQGSSARLLPNRRKGHVTDFADYLDDLEAAIAWASGQGAPEPYLLLGHSMGGHIGLRAIGEGRIRAAGAALVAPMLDIELAPFPPWFARAVTGAAVVAGLGAFYAPGQARNDARHLMFESNPLTTDEARFAAWKELIEAHDEDVISGVTYGWLEAALRSTATAREAAYLRSIDVPVLLVRAGADRIVDNQAIGEAAGLLPRGRLLDIPDARHDLFLEADEFRNVLMGGVREFFATVTS